MSHRGGLARVLLGSALLCGGPLVVAGGLALGGPGLVGVGLAATLAGCTAAGIARESPAPRRGSSLEAAVWAAGLMGGALLLVAGVAALAGGAAATLTVGAGLAVFLAVQGLRAHGSRLRRPPAPRPGTGPSWPVGVDVLLPVSDEVPASRTEPSTGFARLLPPVETLSTAALGAEWLRTTAALAGPLDPTARQSLVGRREEALDELESRDPVGFARWLAAGSTRGSDPADYVRGGPAHQGPVADTDAA